MQLDIWSMFNSYNFTSFVYWIFISEDTIVEETQVFWVLFANLVRPHIETLIKAFKNLEHMGVLAASIYTFERKTVVTSYWFHVHLR